jgi:hypothetical protein
MEGEQTPVAHTSLPHETQPCATCGALPEQQSSGIMSNIQPPDGWDGEPVPICAPCGGNKVAHQEAVVLGEDRFWVSPKRISVCAGSTWRDWEAGDSVAVMRKHRGTWWLGAHYGRVISAERGNGQSKGYVTVQWPGEIKVHRPWELVAKIDPYKED